MEALNTVNLKVCQIMAQTVLQYKELSSNAPLYASNEDEVVCLQVAYDGETQNLVKRIDELLQDSFYLEFFTNFYTLPRLASYYSMPLEVATLLHKLGKQWHETKHGKPLSITERMEAKQTTKNAQITDNAPIAIMPPKYKVEPITINGRDQFVVYPFCYTIDNVPLRECIFCNTLADLEKIKF